jgi:hypothetical protein
MNGGFSLKLLQYAGFIRRNEEQIFLEVEGE